MASDARVLPPSNMAALTMTSNTEPIRTPTANRTRRAAAGEGEAAGTDFEAVGAGKELLLETSQTTDPRGRIGGEITTTAVAAEIWNRGS